ncbi:hypothetical protein CJ217_04750 [Streptococcus sp. UMB1385]|jgi:hypothetical protein|nr:hypothetical protein CJ217_04750 [Streptococcus sp. UMB1385]
MKNKTLLISTALITLLTTGTFGTLASTQNTYASESGSAQLVTKDKQGQQPPVKPGSGGFGGSGTINQGTSANTIDSDENKKDENYISTGDDENALRVKGAKVSLEDIEINKTGGSTSNTEDGDFYGMNAGLLATDKATVNIKNAKVKTTAQNGNGVFSYGEGTTVNISDSEIYTTNDNSGGIQTTGGATMNAKNLNVKTEGNSSAAIRSDRGGGKVNVDGGEYVSKGYNSPAIYSTADITVKNANLKAENSEALVIEGQNSITLENTKVEGNMSDDKGSSSDTNVHNVMIYQSMSGDAEVGKSVFNMKEGTLTNNNGDLIYVTNTTSEITLENVKIENNDQDGRLLAVLGNDASHGWGTAGSNGGNVTLKAKDQKLDGKIEVDTISTLNLTLSGSTEFNGTVNIVDNLENGESVENNAEVTIEEDAVWNLTGDVKISKLNNKGKINFNGYKITLADGTVISE